MINHESKKWIRDNSVYLCEGAPYKDEHTALINPEIRNTMNLTRAMMVYAKSRALGDRRFLHPWAVTYAMLVRNMTRLVNRNGVCKTRYEWSTGNKPDISKLCYWGCVGYRKIPDIIRGDKQSDKSDIGFFMGYDYDGKSTLVYIPSKKKVIRTGDFIFDELAESSDILKYVKNINDDVIPSENGHTFDLILDESNGGSDDTKDSTTETAPDNAPDAVVEQSPKRRRLIAKAEDLEAPSEAAPNKRVTRTGGVRTGLSYVKYFKGDDSTAASSDYVNMLEKSATMAADTYKEGVDDDLDKLYDRINLLISKGLDYVNNTVTMTESHESLRDVKLRHPKIIHSKRIDENNNVKYKTRCVIAAWNLEKGVDYDETFSPTVKQDSLKALLVTALQMDLDIHHIDWETAYLNSDIAEDIYLSIPKGYDITAEARKKGFAPDDPSLCLKLKKSLYGTPQAGRNWNKDVHELLLREGFKSFPKDPCVYIRKNPDGSIIILGLYVDDLLLCSKNDKYLRDLKRKLNAKYKLNDLGPVRKFIGIRITRYADRIEMDLEQYIDKLLEKFSMKDCRVSDVPATAIDLSQCSVPRQRRRKSICLPSPIES